MFLKENPDKVKKKFPPNLFQRKKGDFFPFLLLLLLHKHLFKMSFRRAHANTSCEDVLEIQKIVTLKASSTHHPDIFENKERLLI